MVVIKKGPKENLNLGLDQNFAPIRNRGNYVFGPAEGAAEGSVIDGFRQWALPSSSSDSWQFGKLHSPCR